MNKTIKIFIILNLIHTYCIHGMLQRRATLRLTQPATRAYHPTMPSVYTVPLTPAQPLLQFNPIKTIQLPKLQIPKKFFQVKSYSDLMKHINNYSSEMFHNTLETYAMKKIIGPKNVQDIEEYFFKNYCNSDPAKYLAWRNSQVAYIRATFIIDLIEMYDKKLAAIGLSSEERKIYDGLLHSYKSLYRPFRYDDVVTNAYKLSQARSTAQRLAKEPPESLHIDSKDSVETKADPLEHHAVEPYNPIPHNLQATVQKAVREYKPERVVETLAKTKLPIIE